MALSDAQDAASMAAAAAMMAVAGAKDPVAASNAYGYAKMAAGCQLKWLQAATTSADGRGSPDGGRGRLKRQGDEMAAGMRGLAIHRLWRTRSPTKADIDNADSRGPRTGSDDPQTRLQRRREWVRSWLTVASRVTTRGTGLLQ